MFLLICGGKIGYIMKLKSAERREHPSDREHHSKVPHAIDDECFL